MAKRICVFCGSSAGARPNYLAAASELARHLVSNKISIVYGGSNVGLMGALADAALQAGGEVIGVMPRALVQKEVAHTRLSDLRVVGSMHERKALMSELSDAFIALPGGYGTLEAQRARLRAARQSRNSQVLWAARLIPSPFCASSSIEFCEVLTWTQLGLQRKPCGILNIEGYYDHLLALFDHAVAEQFVKPVHRRIVLSDSDPELLISRRLEQSGEQCPPAMVLPSQ